MKTVWAKLGLALALLAATAAAQQVQLRELTAGGRQAQGAVSKRVHGAVLGHGMGGAVTASAASPGRRLRSGFISMLGPIVARNVADPVWLEMSSLGEPLPAAPRRLASWRAPLGGAPEPIEKLVEVTGWQL